MYYPEANGKHQSPIDIETNKTVYNEALDQHKIAYYYDSQCFEKIMNNGHTFIVFGSTSLGYSRLICVDLGMALLEILS